MELKMERSYLMLLSALCYILILNPAIVESKKSIAKSDYTIYTPEEINALEKIKEIVGDTLYMDLMKSNMVLIHVLRAQNNSIPKAAAMLQKILAWRKLYDIDTILYEDFTSFQKLYPYWLDFETYNGGPIITVPLWDIRKIMLGGHRTKIIRYIDRIFEESIVQTLVKANITKKEISQGVLILDMNSFTRSHACLLCMEFYYNFIYHLENYYPQVLSDIFVINTPRIFTNLLQILKPLLTEYTEASLQIYGVNKEEWLKAILKEVPIQNLRVQLGGKAKGESHDISYLKNYIYT